MIEPAILDYGTLGLLAAVLVGIGLFLRAYLNREQEQKAVRDQGTRDDLKELTANLTELVAKDAEAKVQLSAVLGSLCEEMRGSQAGFSKMTERMDKAELRAEKRHEQQMKQAAERHAEIIAALKALNGKT